MPMQLSAMLTRRATLKLLSAGAAGAFLAACAPVAAPSGDAPVAAAEPVTVRYAHMNCWDEVLCGGQRDLTTEFNENNADVQVEGVEWSWGNYLATLTASVSAGEAPDVMNVGWGEV